MACEPFEQPSIGNHFRADGVVHDLGNLIQIAASAVNIIGRSPHNRGGAMLEPTIARARTALLQAGALVRQTVQPPTEPTLLWRTADLQDIGSCLEEIWALIEWTCQPDITLSLELADNLPGIACNRLELQNAILNLVINARDATPKGGAIRIIAGLNAASPSRIDLTVADDGVGMSRETLLAAFRPYFTTKSQGRGAGLGLPMVHRFAEQAGGRVDIESAPGAGAAVTIRLPVATPDSSVQASAGDQTVHS